MSLGVVYIINRSGNIRIIQIKIFLTIQRITCNHTIQITMGIRLDEVQRFYVLMRCTKGLLLHELQWMEQGKGYEQYNREGEREGE